MTYYKNSFLIFSFLIVNLSYAGVSLDYPGLFSGDKTLPGIPSKKIDEYKRELKEWSRNCAISSSCNIDELSNNTIDTYVNKALYIGFNTDVFINVDGVNQSINIKNYQINDQIRDIIFLDSFKSSILDWQKNYIDVLGKAGSTVMSETFQRAFKIYSRFRDYTNESGFSDEHSNPILNALFGAGNTSYGNLFSDDGVLESYAEGVFTNAISNFSSNVSGKSSFLNNLTLSKTDAVSLGTGFAINVLKDSKVISGDTALFLDNLSTASFGIASGGLGLTMAPATIFYNSTSYIAVGLHEKAQGAHLINYYYFMKAYPSNPTQYLSQTGQLKDWYSLKTDQDSICTSSAIDRDKILKALCFHNYNGYLGTSAATEDEIRTAYSIANLFILVQSLDIEAMKREVVARVKLEELKDHGFYLLNSYISENKYTLSLPEKIVNDNAHGGFPSAVQYQYNGVDIFSAYSNALTSVVDITGTGLPKQFSFDLGKNAATKKTAFLETTITYGDGFEKKSTLSLIYYPQVTNLALLDIPAQLNSTVIPMTVKFCGDSTSHAIIYYKNTDALTWQNMPFILTNPVNLGDNCKKYVLKVNRNEIDRDINYGNVQLKVSVSDKVSDIEETEFPNPEDVDRDKIPDSWEMKYFGNLNQGLLGDFDKDGKNNYQEYLNGTNPKKAGIAGIIKTLVLKPYQLIDGTTISTFHYSGEIWANVILENGFLDIAGQSLNIKGSLIHSDGLLDVNNGKLIIDGDYLIQSRSIDSNNTVLYGTSNGTLRMTDSAGYVLVKGNFVTQLWRNSSDFTGGILEVKGDFTRKNAPTWGEYGCCHQYWNFSTSDTHKVLLSGGKKQTVNFELPNGSNFNILEIKNTAGIVFTNPVPINQLIVPKSIKTLDLKEGMSWTLTNNVTIVGEMITSGSIDLNGKTLTIKGNLIHSDGTLNINNGRLIVEGDYRIQSRNIDSNGVVSYSTGYGALQMTNSADYILVKGNFVTEYGSNSSDALTSGVLEVKGDFTRKEPSTYVGCCHQQWNFSTSGTHKVVLSGNTKQTITFESPHHSNFNILEIKNTSSQGISFTTDVVISKLFNHRNKKFTALATLTTPDFDSDGISDAQDPNPTDALVKIDIDKDGIPDYWEQLNNLNPNSKIDASQDPDNDGYNNLKEYQNDTNPYIKNK